jgi:superfamily II DNA helicase RecQ
MEKEIAQFLNRCLLVDIEINEKNVIYSLGAVLLHGLREYGCDDPKCGFCREHHDPRVFLTRFFGFADFRPQPATPEGRSLQGEVVAAAARNSTLFATLPTGGGKSLCYLLPALMRYQRRNLLTIVLSPLQALMKDQVDNFSNQTGTRLAAALYGMLTMVERGEVMEGVRLGDIGILYVSPEQLRNRSFVETISQREIGAWVFDEAHCLAKWGHERTNLHYEVFSVTRHEKNQAILKLLQQRYTGRGCVVIYCATQKNTERLAEFLRNGGYAAEAFHAGLEAPLKKRILEQFVAGEIPVICATNAFGMGIDKEDVRLVLHSGLIAKETTLSAYLRYKVANNATLHLQRISPEEKPNANLRVEFTLQ